MDQFLRLDTGSYPGFSGSAFVLPNGKIAGMNTSAFSRHFGLVVPSSNIDRLIQRLNEKGSIGKPHLGVMMQPVPIPENLRVSSGTEIGLLVRVATKIVKLIASGAEFADKLPRALSQAD